MRGKRSGGFTLIEILCVCIILAIAARITIPYVSNGYADVKLRAAARSLMADIYYAQNLAITNQQNVFIVFTAATSSTGGSYTVKSGATLAAATTVKHPGDGLDYTQYFGTRTNATEQQMQRPTFSESQLGTLPSGFTAIGFDYMGKPLNGDLTDMTSRLTLNLKSRGGNMGVNLYVEPYTGELTADDKIGNAS